jgi:hypothetical protein
MKPIRVLPRTKIVLHGTKKSSSKAFPMGIAEKPF